MFARCAAKNSRRRTSVWRFFKRHDITFKKSLRAAEQSGRRGAGASALMRAGLFAGRLSLAAAASECPV